MIDDIQLYERLYTIRRFEETLLENFPKGVFFGTTHTSLGQEANAVGVLSQVRPSDVVFSNHRGHGHFLAAGGDPRALFAELMGRLTGVCGGRGGSQHLCWGNFYSNGVQGGISPVATGMALAEKHRRSGAVVIAFIGDGTLGEGVVYEAFNMAALWKAPLLYVLENNRIAQTTPIEQGVAGSIAGRFSAFGIPFAEIDSSDVRAIYSLAGEQLDLLRNNSGPRALILHTYRFGPHSKGDDTRPPDVMQRIRQQRDPLNIQAARLDAGSLEQMQAAVNARIEQAYQAALADPYPILDWQVTDAQ
jgi:acetoin:2,6-dichlorophenolindophenol oxidoreductase subunit alpha